MECMGEVEYVPAWSPDCTCATAVGETKTAPNSWQASSPVLNKSPRTFSMHLRAQAMTACSNPTPLVPSSSPFPDSAPNVFLTSFLHSLRAGQGRAGCRRRQAAGCQISWRVWSLARLGVGSRRVLERTEKELEALKSWALPSLVASRFGVRWTSSVLLS